MSTQQMYDRWSSTYDQVENPTRDLEKHACEKVLGALTFDLVIELGSGTGKNTEWLASRAKYVTCVDLSSEMQSVARAKVDRDNVHFVQGDIRGDWSFLDNAADLITCSLILEHIENLDSVFQEAFSHLNRGGHFYVCELHPCKQYAGSKARYEADGELHVLDCYQHHITEYTDSAAKAGFTIERMNEWFDGNDRSNIPRLISFLFKREANG
jgi:ubiquinone/menaquinone biosynthesis C-methylase UbiE